MPFTLKNPLEEKLNVNVQFALLLRDGFADSDELLGKVEVKIGTLKACRKGSSGLFWFQKVTPGNQAISVSSSEDPPYYLAKTFSVTVSAPPPPAPAPCIPHQSQ